MAVQEGRKDTNNEEEMVYPERRCATLLQRSICEFTSHTHTQLSTNRVFNLLLLYRNLNCWDSFHLMLALFIKCHQTPNTLKSSDLKSQVRNVNS